MGYKPEHAKAKQAIATKKYRALHRDRYNAGRRASWAKLRSDLLEAYGKQCNCCGETNPLFLTIDHLIPPDDRKKYGMMYLRKLRKNGYPKGYVTACYNCNAGRYRNGGCCPHMESQPSTSYN